MKSSLKLKFNSQTGETSLTNAEGVDLLKPFPFITEINVSVTATDIPQIVIKLLCIDELEIETDTSSIETKELHTGYIKENQAAKVERYENKLRSEKLQEAFSKGAKND